MKKTLTQIKKQLRENYRFILVDKGVKGNNY